MVLEKRCYANDDRITQLEDMLKQATYIQNETENKYDEVGSINQVYCQSRPPDSSLSSWVLGSVGTATLEGRVAGLLDLPPRVTIHLHDCSILQAGVHSEKVSTIIAEVLIWMTQS